ncbi:hypothetical protein MASR2M78_20430 [Treponema sp.]
MKGLETKLAVVEKEALVDYGFYGGVRGGRGDDELERGMAEIADKVLGFKCYLLSGMETFPRVNHEELGRALVAAEALDRPLLLHAEDADYVAAATKRVKDAKNAEGKSLGSWDDYVDSRPESAELVACAVAASLALERSCPATLHVVHVGTSAAAEVLAKAGATCETCAHYLAFSREDFAQYGSALKTAPPVKGSDEKERLWALLAAGTIPFVTSDHAPASRAEKRSGSIWTDYGGIPGTGILLPFMLSEGYLSGRLSLPRFLEAVSSAAALRFGIADRKGSIAVGKDADFVLIDTAGTTTIRGEELYSKGSDTPFEGMVLRGSIRATYLRGKKVYDGDSADAKHPAKHESRVFDGSAAELSACAPGIVAKPGYGRFLTRGPK